MSDKETVTDVLQLCLYVCSQYTKVDGGPGVAYSMQLYNHTLISGPYA